MISLARGQTGPGTRGVPCRKRIQCAVRKEGTATVTALKGRASAAFDIAPLNRDVESSRRVSVTQDQGQRRGQMVKIKMSIHFGFRSNSGWRSKGRRDKCSPGKVIQREKKDGQQPKISGTDPAWKPLMNREDGNSSNTSHEPVNQRRAALTSPRKDKTASNLRGEKLGRQNARQI